MRTGFATVLVLLGCLLAGPAVVAYLLVDEVTDRDTYLEAVTPLADDPGVQQEVSGQISAAFDDKVPAAAKPNASTIASFVSLMVVSLKCATARAVSGSIVGSLGARFTAKKIFLSPVMHVRERRLSSPV